KYFGLQESCSPCSHNNSCGWYSSGAGVKGRHSGAFKDGGFERLLFLHWSMNSQKVAIVFLCLTIVYACGIRPGPVKRLVKARPLFVTGNTDIDMPGSSNDTVIVTYLGCGGLLIG